MALPYSANIQDLKENFETTFKWAEMHHWHRGRKLFIFLNILGLLGHEYYHNTTHIRTAETFNISTQKSPENYALHFCIDLRTLSVFFLEEGFEPKLITVMSTEHRNETQEQAMWASVENIIHQFKTNSKNMRGYVHRGV